MSLNARHGNGDKQTSKVGGALTMLVYGFMIVYVALKAIKMGGGNLDTVVVSEEVTDYAKEGKVYLHGMTPYIEV